jgi:hypothetical protein
LTRALAATLALACFLLLPASARADGDPASDYLLVRDVFLPFQVTIEPSATEGLDREIRATKARGFPIKVALIAHPYDLGAVPQLYGEPQQYA